MKFLSFKHNDRTSYGVKVKREDAVWDLPMVLLNLVKKIFIPKHYYKDYNKPDFRFSRTST